VTVSRESGAGSTSGDTFLVGGPGRGVDGDEFRGVGESSGWPRKLKPSQGLTTGSGSGKKTLRGLVLGSGAGELEENGNL
jgi:hypothetical protein